MPNKEIIMKHGLILLALFSFIATLAQPTFAATDYLMSCRGKLDYFTGTGSGTTVVFVNKNATRAGPNGTWLQPGTCAWQDRPISSTEPSRIFIPEYINYFYGRANSPATIALSQCASDDSCVISFYLHNVNNSYFISNSPTTSRVNYPF
jgi:hypothetical protein